MCPFENIIMLLLVILKVRDNIPKSYYYKLYSCFLFQLPYPNAKKLNTSIFLLEENEHFNYIPVNLTLSTVHVPTNVYDHCK